MTNNRAGTRPVQQAPSSATGTRQEGARASTSAAPLRVGLRARSLRAVRMGEAAAGGNGGREPGGGGRRPPGGGPVATRGKQKHLNSKHTKLPRCTYNNTCKRTRLRTSDKQPIKIEN